MDISAKKNHLLIKLSFISSVVLSGLLAVAIEPLRSEPATIAEKSTPANNLFQFKLELDDVLTVDKYQDILIYNGQERRTKEEKNRIVLKVIGKGEDYSLLEGNFITYSRTPRQTGEFKLESNYFSRFKIFSDGRYEVPDEYLMPNLRDLPTFPNFPLKPKGSWVSPATETIQLDDIRLKIPVSVNYRYTGINSLPEETYAFASHHIYRKEEFDRFEYNYTIAERVTERKTGVAQIDGFASDVLWFDRDNGIPLFDSNRIAYKFRLRNGQELNYQLKILSWYRKTKRIDQNAKKELASKLSSELKTLPAISVKNANDGILLTMKDILFEFDSAEIGPTMQQSLKQVAEILNRHPEREVRISGHTDNSGDKEYNLELSTRRARAVLKELRRLGVDDRRLSYKGYGEEKPLTDNQTPASRAQNRRVEILIVTD